MAGAQITVDSLALEAPITKLFLKELLDYYVCYWIYIFSHMISLLPSLSVFSIHGITYISMSSIG